MMGKRKRLPILALGMVLVLALVIAPVAADTMTREDGTDRDGNDYTSLFPGTLGYNGTPESCSENCLNQPVCNAATFAARDQSCWLKEKVPVATQRSGMTSFIRQKAGAAGPVTASATQASTAAPAGTPAPVATKKSPGFEGIFAVLGCLGILMIRRGRQ